MNATTEKQDVLPPEEITPQAMLEHFVANFYKTFKGENPDGHYTHMYNTAVEGSYWRGFARGKEEGYRRGYLAAKDEIRTEDEKAEAAAQQVIGSLCQTKWKRVD